MIEVMSDEDLPHLVLFVLLGVIFGFDPAYDLWTEQRAYFDVTGPS